ncbi:MAG: hypothetical protein Unbinned4585contig1001_25 [Prokaryotic dsDNA virus sp.]|nr:MAG: hypothetical protein Unbinned4585contig1001_25 [Prokaryotic dsDNA virus sp.]|tara:strand:- start:869 stop:1468 length:600 start_codon:yes stop_codon:yes gene_type:complete
MKYKQAQKLLHKYGKSITRQAKKIIKSKKKKSSGALIKSIKYKVKKSRKGFDIEFLKTPYGEFIDKGVRGVGRSILPAGSTTGQHGTKMKPNRTYIDELTGKRKRSPYSFRKNARKKSGSFYRSLDKWIIKKGIAPRDKDGKFISRKSMKYIVARGIKAKGIEGISFYSQPLAASRKNFRKNLMGALQEDVLNNLRIVK